MLSILLGATAGAMSVSAAPAACTDALLEIAQDRACLVSRSGVAIADSPERAADLLGWAEDGSARVAARLAIAPARYAVIDGQGGDGDPAMQSQLALMGYTVVLNWLSPQAVQRQMEDNVAETVRRQMAASGIDGPRLDAIVASAVAQVAGQMEPASVRKRDSVVVPHELAHRWLEQAFWPGIARIPGQYGGPAPDWLEEMLALLAEPDHSLAERREQFWQIYRNKRGAGQESGFDDLSRFLAAPHPMAGKLGATGAQGGRGFTVRVLDSSDPSLGGFNPGHYYLQALLFHDFLAAHGLGADTLRSLIVTISKGASLEDWLAAEGPAMGLPDSLAGLEMGWRSWLAEQAGT